MILKVFLFLFYFTLNCSCLQNVTTKRHKDESTRNTSIITVSTSTVTTQVSHNETTQTEKGLLTKIEEIRMKIKEMNQQIKINDKLIEDLKSETQKRVANVIIVINNKDEMKNKMFLDPVPGYYSQDNETVELELVLQNYTLQGLHPREEYILKQKSEIGALKRNLDLIKKKIIFCYTCTEADNNCNVVDNTTRYQRCDKTQGRYCLTIKIGNKRGKLKLTRSCFQISVTPQKFCQAQKLNPFTKYCYLCSDRDFCNFSQIK